MRGQRLSLFTIFLIILFKSVSATVWYVHPDSALNTIKDGLNSCSAGDTVLVAPAVYIELINIPGTPGIQLLSECGPESTIIDGNDSGRVISIYTRIDTTTVIRGFTIRNGYADFQGGGIWCASNSSPTIKGNIITNNTTGLYGGGGIACSQNSAPIIDGNIITFNTADYGGGIKCDSSEPTITGNTISDNTAGCGGGIWCTLGSSPIISGNTVSKNTFLWYGGGGIGCTDMSSPTIDSCTISNNTGDGVYCEFGSCPVINFCDIIDNSAFGVRNVDPDIIVDATYNWWGDKTGPGGAGPGAGEEVSDWVDFDPWLGAPVPVEEEPKNRIAFDLKTHPNPTKGKLSLNFALDDPSQVKIKLYDLTGRRVVTVHDNKLSEGEHKFSIVLPNELSSGIYFLRFEAGDVKETRKILITK